jgi:hypothetical protein
MVRTAGLHLLLRGILRFTTSTVTPRQWEPATWLSGDYHDRTSIGESSGPFKAHQRFVGWQRSLHGMPQKCLLPTFGSLWIA